MSTRYSSKRRLGATAGHLRGAIQLTRRPVASNTTPTLITTQADGAAIRVPAFPMQRQDVLKWNGWGYRGCGFELGPNNVIWFQGERYDFGGTALPDLLPFFEARGMSLADLQPAQEQFYDQLPKPISNPAFMAAIEGHHGGLSVDTADRVFRSHGHTTQELYALRYGRPGRIPDAVVWPETSEHAEAIVKAAQRYNVILIPFGGGTTVTGALLCPEDESRMIVSVDTSKMNRIHWIDTENLMARIEAGVTGMALEEKLAEFGVCTGHTPDSYEFSTLGGWVATRASGMKKNIYGNIEDMLVRAKMVTPTGVVEKNVQIPRMSAGPDINEIIMGSEGTLGLVTEATLKIRKLPESVVYGSLLFPSFEAGVGFMIEVAQRRLQPASVRLIDNEQFHMGHALKEEVGSQFTAIMDAIKTFYVTKIKGFDKDSLTVCTLLFEGDADEVALHEAKIKEVAGRHGGFHAGEEAGKRGYLLTFVIAYIRDIAFDYQYIGESFETSLPFSCTINLSRNVKDAIIAICEEEGVEGKPFASCRVTQLYDTGVCVYFYFGFLTRGLADPMRTFHRIERGARQACIDNGGSISHHHGVGKVRKQWLEETSSTVGLNMVKAVKAKVDPKNIFAVDNLYDHPKQK